MKTRALVVRRIALLPVLLGGLSAAGAAPNFGTVADRLMIEDLCARYVMALDTADADRYSARHCTANLRFHASYRHEPGAGYQWVEGDR